MKIHFPLNFFGFSSNVFAWCFYFWGYIFESYSDLATLAATRTTRLVFAVRSSQEDDRFKNDPFPLVLLPTGGSVDMQISR